MISKPPAWMADGLCTKVGEPEDWYPETSGPPRAAKEACTHCPVAAECLAHALSLPMSEDYGVWGGTSRMERLEMRQQQRKRDRKRAPINHGTTGGFRTHRRRGEEPCAACRGANRAANRAKRKPGPCVDCGGPRDKRATRCAKCAQARSAARLNERKEVA